MAKDYVSSMNRNIKLSPTYLALTYDVLFVWAISTMFFSNVKHISYSQIVALDSILMAFGCIMCIPLNKLLSNFSSVFKSRIGAISYAFYILLCIIGTEYWVFVIAQIFLAFAYVMNGVNSNAILADSLKSVNRSKEYEKIYGSAMTIHYAIETIGAVVATYLYQINPYLAYFVSLGLVVVSVIESFFFKDTEMPKEYLKTKEPIKKEQPDKLKTILSSWFLISLLIFMFFFRGILSVVGSGFKIYLQEAIGAGVIPVWLFGYIYAGSKLVTAISSKIQFKLNLRYGVRLVIILMGLTILSFLGCGLIYLISPYSIVSLILIIVLSYIGTALKSPGCILVNNYMNVCVKEKNRDTAFSVRISVEYLGYAIISAIYSMLLGITNDHYGWTNVYYVLITMIPALIATTLFIRFIIREYSSRNTIIKREYTEDYDDI